jgi:hypothetical protein
MVMEQYKSEEVIDTPTKPITASSETKHIQSVESMVKQLQDTVGIQQQEIFRLKRDIGRLKGEISDIISVLKNRG